MPTTTSLHSKVHEWTSVAPLLAAVFAPFSILFDIPALTEPWFIHADPNVLLDPNAANGVPDRRASLALSAIGLAFNICANALLIVRFSATAGWWRVATRMSVLFWILKVIIALVNLCVFGPLDPGTQRGEGLWCAVVSLIISGLITFLLISHWVFDFTTNRREREPTEAQLAVRVAGRHFMLNVTFFVFDLGLLALLASQVENWTYLQGIYFGTVTYLTIGFGDFYVTHTVTRILLFFFALVGIAQLGNIVGMLVDFFGSRSADKRAESRKEYERKRQAEEESRPGMKPDLGKEMEFLHRLGEREEAKTRTFQLLMSLAGLIVFWVVGAAIFSQLEGWAYGTGLYFAYVSFLTIGYGDFTPITPAGRVVFVLYAIVAVPIMASFVVQAVQQIFAAFSARQYSRTKAKKGLDLDLEEPHGQRLTKNKIMTHAEFVEKWNCEWEEQVRIHKAQGYSEDDAQSLADQDQEKRGDLESAVDDDREMPEHEQALKFEEDARLTDKILESALSLEWRARKLLIRQLEGDGGKHGPVRTARLLLKADRNVQLREVKGLLKKIEEEQGIRGADDGDRLDTDADADAVAVANADPNVQHPALKGARSAAILQHILQDDPDILEIQTDDGEMLEEIRKYRQDFASLLAAGSRLMGLKGTERALFERRSLRSGSKLEGDTPHT